ncbi:MAG: hypothetical protein R3A45_08555 [Bdellovibrionota bacterium]
MRKLLHLLLGCFCGLGFVYTSVFAQTETGSNCHGAMLLQACYIDHLMQIGQKNLVEKGYGPQVAYVWTQVASASGQKTIPTLRFEKNATDQTNNIALQMDLHVWVGWLLSMQQEIPFDELNPYVRKKLYKKITGNGTVPTNWTETIFQSWFNKRHWFDEITPLFEARLLDQIHHLQGRYPAMALEEVFAVIGETGSAALQDFFQHNYMWSQIFSPNADNWGLPEVDLDIEPSNHFVYGYDENNIEKATSWVGMGIERLNFGPDECEENEALLKGLWAPKENGERDDILKQCDEIESKMQKAYKSVKKKSKIILQQKEQRKITQEKPSIDWQVLPPGTYAFLVDCSASLKTAFEQVEQVLLETTEYPDHYTIILINMEVDHAHMVMRKPGEDMEEALQAFKKYCTFEGTGDVFLNALAKRASIDLKVDHTYVISDFEMDEGYPYNFEEGKLTINRNDPLAKAIMSAFDLRTPSNKKIILSKEVFIDFALNFYKGKQNKAAFLSNMQTLEANAREKATRSLKEALGSYNQSTWMGQVMDKYEIDKIQIRYAVGGNIQIFQGDDSIMHSLIKEHQIVLF